MGAEDLSEGRKNIPAVQTGPADRIAFILPGHFGGEQTYVHDVIHSVDPTLHHEKYCSTMDVL